MAALFRLKRVSSVGKLVFRNVTYNSAPKVSNRLTANSELFRCHRNLQLRALSTQAEAAPEKEFHSIIKDGEKPIGASQSHEFQAETRMLLDIVAKSLYSEKEVFVRELISNASDALEKRRYVALTASPDAAADASTDAGPPLEIHVATDKQRRVLTIQDTGIGMTREELISNLGTIARSGSKAFMEQLKEKTGAADTSSIIGQFGVGFYSTFMVADKVEVFTRSATPGSPGLKWVSDGCGSYEIQEAEGVQVGTKIVLHLKQDCREFSDEDTVNAVIKKYSNFVGSPILVNGQLANTVQPLWLADPKDAKDENVHADFYRFVGGAYDRPRFILHYVTDAPLSIRALLYFPEGKPGLFEMSRETDVGVALYTRKVLIKSKADNILPKWLRFVKGVVDSEDIPLNLSRELLQNSALIRKLRTVLTNRILRFLHDKATKQTEEYDRWYADYGLFLKEGIVTSQEQHEKEEISKLLRFESSQSGSSRVGLPAYCGRLKEGQKSIFYLAAPSRALAEASPYFEALKKKDVEVLFCYEPHDELVLMQLREFDGHPLVSVEKEMRQDKEADNLADTDPESLSAVPLQALLKWTQQTLAGRAHAVRATLRLDSHPCVVTVEEMAAARHFIRTQAQSLPEESRYSLLQPRLEINPRHPIIKKLSKLTTSNPQLAELVTNQLFSNAMVSAGLVEDPRTLVAGMNQLLSLALEAH